MADKSVYIFNNFDLRFFRLAYVIPYQVSKSFKKFLKVLKSFLNHLTNFFELEIFKILNDRNNLTKYRT